MAEHALPSSPDVFGVDGAMVGRVAGMLVHFTGTLLARTALRVLGDQFRLIGQGRNPGSLTVAFLHTSATRFTLSVGASLAFALWSYIPLYVLPVTIGGSLLKVLIEEGTMIRGPEFGNEYRLYKFKVPYRILPYI